MTPHIAIIGAGVSGLRCATVLLENSCNVTMIEARNRVGGRIAQSNQMGPLEVDIGANWVHRHVHCPIEKDLCANDDSTGYNPIIELAKETGTPLHRWQENTLLVDRQGHLVTKLEANKALNKTWQILEEALQYSTHGSKDIETTTSLFDFFKDWCEQALHRGDMTEKEVDLLLDMSHMWGAYVGDRIELQSLKFFFLEDCIDGDDCFIPTNYRRIIDHISALPLTQANIQFETAMDTAEVGTGRPRSVCVTSLDGKVQHFDDVVITTPLGWLKKHKDSIRPLHPRVASAIDSISYGRLEKVLIEFPNAFWESTSVDIEESLEGKVSFVHWLSPCYATQPNPKSWRLECVSFHAFEEPYRRNILLFYTFGDCSSHITSSIQGLQGTARDEWLREFFETYYSRLPGYSDACKPLRFLATEWCNDEYAGNGSYSNFQVGMTDAARDVEAIRYGMPDHHIYFAGEHTAPFDGLGTVAGAYTSGERIARRILASKQCADAIQ